MSSMPHYSAARARRSLAHFAVGKGFSALAGISVLLLAVRLMAASDFGLYVAAIAFLEIFYLATGFGLSTVAQRYVAEFRLKAGNVQFASFVRAMLWRRLLYALAGTLTVGAAAALWHATGRPLPQAALAPAFYALLVFGCLTRFMDEIFPALLLQGYTQSLLLAAHLMRLGGLGVFALQGRAVNFEQMLSIELVAVIVCSLGGMLLLWRYLARDHGAQEAGAPHQNLQMRGVARRFYFIQLVGQLWGPNSGKLIVAERLGLATTAQYGFVQSITDMLRNYLPAYLLSTWVRPLMVSRYLDRRDLREVDAMASLIFKLSLMCIVPVAAFFLVQGDAFVRWASGGKFSEGTHLLAAFCLLLALQCLHIVIGMITLTVERPRASVVATVAACAAFPLSIAGAAAFGAPGVVAGMAVGECIWIGLAISLLRREGLDIRLDVRGSLKILLTLAPAYLAVMLVPATFAPVLASVAGLGLAGVVVLAINAVWKPFVAAERSFIHRLVPARFFIW